MTPLLGGLPTKGRVTVLPLREVQHVFLKVGIGVVGPCRALGWQWPPLAKVPVSTREGQQKRSTARRHLMAEVVLQLAWKAVGTTSASVYPVRPEHRHQDSSYKGSAVQGMEPAFDFWFCLLPAVWPLRASPCLLTKHGTSSRTSLSLF